MVFLNKREKAVGKKKASSTPAAAAAVSVVIPAIQDQPAIAPIQFSVKSPTTPSLARDKLPPALQLNQSHLQVPPKPATAPILTPSVAAPWWVSDVTFIVEDKKIPGHKVVLQSRSGYFSQLFQGSTQDVTLEIHDFSHHIFSQFVRWVYGGKKEIAPEDATDLARCASHFQAPELLAICQRIIEETAAAERSKALQEQQEQQLQLQQQQQQQMEVVINPHHQTLQQQSSYDMQHDPVIASVPPHGTDAMIDLLDTPLLNDHSNYVPADPQHDEFGFGMNVWSNDPVLYPSESTDAFRIMEIC